MKFIQGPALRHARKAEGLSLAAVARRLRVRPHTVGRWEAGRTVPPADRLAAYARLLGLSLDRLFLLEKRR